LRQDNLFNYSGSMAGATGLEPATSGVTGRRSNQLSYAPAALDPQRALLVFPPKGVKYAQQRGATPSRSEWWAMRDLNPRPPRCKRSSHFGIGGKCRLTLF
jgi:hypothetical protein